MVKTSRDVITSRNYEEHLTEILAWSIATFGMAQTKKYFLTITHFVERLGVDYTYHPECRHLPTKSRTYRNIILDAHLIIYRITDERIEVLDIVHSASSIRKIRAARTVRL